MATPLITLLGAFFLGCAWEAYAIYLQEHRARIQETSRNTEFEREMMVREQIKLFGPDELRALKHLACCGKLTETELVNRFGVTSRSLLSRVDFLLCDYPTGKYHILPDMESVVRKVMIEIPN